MTSPAQVAPPTPPPPPTEPPEQRRGVPRVLIVLAVVIPTLMILFVMSGMIKEIDRASSIPLIGAVFQFPELLTANTPTGGDMGAHVLLPQIVRDNLLGSGRLLGWSNAWYAGFPVLYFYFPLPPLVTILLDVLLPYGVAFKLVTIAGLVALPAATYFFVRSLNFNRVVAAIATVSGSLFVFMESFSIFGANIKSTLAGEFSFSWAFALSLVYLGLLVRDTRAGRGFRPLPGVVLALTALSHIVPTMIVVAASIPLLRRRKGAQTVLGSWGLGFAISAFWAVPLLIRVIQGMNTDMGWEPVRVLLGEGLAGSPLPGELIPIVVLGLAGLMWTLLRRDDVAVLVWLTIVPLLGYLALPRLGITVLYNARLLPYWYFGLYVFAGLALALAVLELSRRLPQRRQTIVVGATIVGLIALNGAAVAIHDVPGWVRWNFEGYEGKAAYEEYRSATDTVSALPPGRVMWEYSSEHNTYGTPMALMLIPMWSDEHTTMEGVFFESSLTTPFHFLNQSEVSFRPSRPVRGLDYTGLDIARAVPHLGLYDIDYYMSYTEEAALSAEQAGLPVVAESPPFTIFELPPTEAVEVAQFVPAVYDGDADFLEPALDYYADVPNLAHWLVADGPDDWPRVGSADERVLSQVPYSTNAEISDIQVENHRVSFKTNAIGIPHLVKVSYFPNWTASGAEGPFRAAPSLMVVVPTEEEVTLEFNNTWAENMGMTLTVAGLVLVALFVVRARRQRPSVAPSEAPSDLSH